MEYVRTCAAYTGKQVFLINVLRHTHINCINFVIEGSQYLKGGLGISRKYHISSMELFDNA